jgi:hypothetical protein
VAELVFNDISGTKLLDITRKAVFAFSGCNGVSCFSDGADFRELVNFLCQLQRQLDPEKVREVLWLEQVRLITGFSRNASDHELYEFLVLEVDRWREETKFRRQPRSKFDDKFPFFKTTLNYITQALVNSGLQNVTSEIGGGYATIRFTFVGEIFDKMAGLIEIRTKYSGDSRFSVAGGDFLDPNHLHALAEKTNVTGEIHYIKFGLQIPASMGFRIDRSDECAETDRLLKAVLGLVSYYRLAG